MCEMCRREASAGEWAALMGVVEMRAARGATAVRRVVKCILLGLLVRGG